VIVCGLPVLRHLEILCPKIGYAIAFIVSDNRVNLGRFTEARKEGWAPVVSGCRAFWKPRPSGTSPAPLSSRQTAARIGSPYRIPLTLLRPGFLLIMDRISIAVNFPKIGLPRIGLPTVGNVN
jgi:hypothetical protein